MSEKRFVAGSLGPYVYDDDDEYASHWGSPFADEKMQAFISTGQGKILETPTEDEHLVRLTDLDDFAEIHILGTDHEIDVTPSGSNTVTLSLARNIVKPTTLTVTTGTLTSGDITDVQEWNDGNEVNVTEVSATPGFDVRFTFTGVDSITSIETCLHYEGSASHKVELQIYDAVNDAWQTIRQEETSLGHSLKSVSLPPDNINYYIDSGTVILRLYHITAGNPAHDVYINYLAIKQ